MDTTYYWTVEPWFENGKGACVSGIYKFKIDPTSKEFGLRIQPSERNVKLTKGESVSIDIEFSNLGSKNELIEIFLGQKNLTSSIKLLHGETLSIDAESSRTLGLEIDSLNLVHGEYIVTIFADSTLTPAVTSENITINIVKERSKSDSSGLFNNIMDLIPLFIIIIIMIIGLIIIIRYKPKEDELAEDADEVEKMIQRGLAGDGQDTDILYKPTLQSVPGSTWQPQAQAKEKLPEISPYPPEDELPKLPPRQPQPQTGYQPSPTVEPTVESSISESPTVTETGQEYDDFDTPLTPDQPEEIQVPDILLPEDIAPAPETKDAEVSPDLDASSEPKLISVDNLDVARDIELPDMPEPVVEEYPPVDDVGSPQFGESLQLEKIPETQEPEQKSKKDLKKENDEE
jgi:hypothetical protein